MAKRRPKYGPQSADGGMGNPFETEYFYEGYRDAGASEPRPKDVIYDPTCDPNNMPPEKKKGLEETFCLMMEHFKKLILFVKRPAFLEPPFFAKPIIKTAEVTALANAPAFRVILSREIEARQRAIVTAIGIDVTVPAVVDAHELGFRFTLDGETIQIFDDQTVAPLLPAAWGAAMPAGETTIVPGTVEEPFSLIQKGIQFEVKGRKTLNFEVRNVSAATDVNVKALMTYYQYWTPNASEFERGDLQT